jgi:nucleotide-binding universal stress UspA family protein
VTAYLGEQKEIALASAADQFFVGGGLVILVGGLLSTVSALNGTIYSSSRVAFAMARDASLPRAMAGVHPVRGTPHVSILVSTLLIVLMAVALPIEDVAAAASVMFFLLFGGVSVALVRLRKTRPDLDRGFRVPLVPFTPALGIVMMLFIAALLANSHPMAWVAAGGWVAVGLVFYYAYSRNREIAFHARATWMERIERREYRVLIAVSSELTLRSLIEAGLAITRTHGGEVVLVHVVEVPEGRPLVAGRPLPKEVVALLELGARVAQERGFAARTVVKIGRRISQSLVEAAREEACNFLVIGQPRQQSFFERIVSSIVERVLQRAPCQVAVVYGTIERHKVRGIVVPVTAGENSRLAAQLVPAYANWFGVDTRAMTVLEAGEDGPGAERLARETRETLAGTGLAERLRVIRGLDPARELLRAIHPDELVLLGAPSSGPVVPVLGETIPGILARGPRNPLIVVRAVDERRARQLEAVFFSRRS